MFRKNWENNQKTSGDTHVHGSNSGISGFGAAGSKAQDICFPEQFQKYATSALSCARCANQSWS